MSLQAIEFDLQITPGSVPPVLHMAQYDSGRQFTAYLKDETNTAFIPGAGATAKIKGFNAAGVAWEQVATVDGSTVVFTPSGAATDQFGVMPVTIEITVGEEVLTPLLVVFDIQRAGYTNEQAVRSPEFQTAIEAAVAAAIEEGGLGFSEDFKEALLACFAHVAWASDDGQDYYDALEATLYPGPGPATLVSITADYQQDRPIYDTDDLDVIKTSDDLTVTANYSDGSSVVLDDDDYTISGTLTVGTSTITVSYGGKTTTISVLVSSSVTTGYVAVGNPTIADNILTVENGKYIRSTVALSPSTGQAWKVRMKLKYTTLSTAFVNIIGGSGSDSFAKTLVVQENTTHQYIMYVSADKTNWTFSNMYTGQMSLSTNTWYYLELGYDGTNYYMTVKTGGWDGTVVTNGSKSAASNVLIYGGEYIGFGVNSSVSGFAGQVDLSDCSMYVGDQLVWKAV